MSLERKSCCLSNLVAALNIFLKYGDIGPPTHCEHDILMVNVDPDKVSDDDHLELARLGFYVSRECGETLFVSHLYGSS